MKTYLVHVSDAGSMDCQTPVAVSDGASLAEVAQIALAELEEQIRGEVQFPLFLDIHHANEFEPVAWMHGLHQS